MQMSRNGLWCLLLIMVVSLCACSTPAEKVQKFMARGDANFAKGKYVKAVLEYRNAFTIDPNYVEAYYQAGQAELKQGKVQNAYSFFMKTVEKQPDHIGANLQLGKLLLGAREFVKVRERVDIILGKEPDNQQAMLLQGGILLGERKPDQARDVLKKLLPRTDKEVDFYLLLAAAYGQLGETAESETLLQEGIAKNPASIPLLIGLANFYLEEKQSVKVEETLQKIIALEPGKDEHVERLAAYQWHEGRKTEADALLQGILAKAKGGEEPWVKVAAFYLSRQAVDKVQQVVFNGLQQNPQSFKLRFLLQQGYLVRGEVGKAVGVLQQCLTLNEKNPDFVMAQRRLAELYFRIGNVAKAEELVAAVLAKSPNDVEAHLLKGGILVLQADFDQAIAEYRTVLQARPKDVAVYVKLADAFVRNKQNSLALDILKQGLQVAPAPELHRTLARLYILEKKVSDAEAQLQKMVEQHPEDMAVKIELADFYMANDGREKAQQIYKSVIGKAPANPVAYLRLSSLYVLGKQDKEATETVAAGIAAIPDDNGLLEQGVQLYLRMGQPDAALNLTRERLHRHPDDIFAINMQGNIYAVNKDYGQAEQSYRRVLSLQADIPETAIHLARIITLAGKLDQTISDTEKLIGTTPGSSASQYILLAELYERNGQHEKGLAVLDRALIKHPENWFIMNSLAYSLGEGQHTSVEELARAEGLAQKAQMLAPGNSAVLDTVGWLSLKMGKIMQARAALTMALDRNPNNPVFNYHLGVVLIGAGKKEVAKELLEKAVRSPGNFSEREEAKKVLQGLTI